MLFYYIVIILCYGFLATAGEINLNIPVQVTIENNKRALDRQQFSVPLGAIKHFESIFGCVEDCNAPVVFIPITRQKIWAPTYLKNILLLAQDLYEKKQVEDESKQMEEALWKNHDMLEYVSLADEYEASKDVYEAIIKRGPNQLTNQLKPYILDLYAKPEELLVPAQERKIDNKQVKLIFAQVLKKCTNEVTKEFWLDYFYEKQYSNKEFEALWVSKDPAVTYSQDGHKVSQAWGDWRASFEHQSFFNASHENERMVFNLNLYKNKISPYAWSEALRKKGATSDYTHLPLWFLCAEKNDWRDDPGIDFENNKPPFEVDWQAVRMWERQRRKKIHNFEISLHVNDLSSIPWGWLGSAERGRLKLNLILPSNIEHPNNVVHDTILAKKDTWYLIKTTSLKNKTLGVLAASVKFSCALLLELLIARIYTEEKKSYAQKISQLIDVTPSEVRATASLLLQPNQSLLPHVCFSISSYATLPFVQPSASPTLAMVQAASKFIHEINLIRTPFWWAVGTIGLMIISVSVFGGWLVSGLSKDMPDETVLVMRDGKSLRKFSPLSFDMYDDDKRGCLVQIHRSNANND